MELLSRNIIPLYLYPLTMAPTSQVALKHIYNELRGAIKEYLHLPTSTANGLIYAAKKDGGLGFPKLEIVIVSSSLKAGWKFLNNPYPAIQAISENSAAVSKMKTLAHTAKLGWPIASPGLMTDTKSKPRKKNILNGQPYHLKENVFSRL